VSGQLHAQPASFTSKVFSSHIGQEFGCAHELVYTGRPLPSLTEMLSASLAKLRRVVPLPLERKVKKI
jgi:hypothetical protein